MNDIERREFNKQPFEKKAYLINRHAEQISMIKIGTETIVYLMHMNGQFVELWFDRTKGQVADIYMPELDEISMFLEEIFLPGIRTEKGFYLKL